MKRKTVLSLCLIVLLLLLGCITTDSAETTLVDKMRTTIHETQETFGKLGIQHGIGATVRALLVQERGGTKMDIDSITKDAEDCLYRDIKKIRERR